MGASKLWSGIRRWAVKLDLPILRWTLHFFWRLVQPTHLQLRGRKASGAVILLLGPPVGTKRHFPAGQEMVPGAFGAFGNRNPAL